MSDEPRGVRWYRIEVPKAELKPVYATDNGRRVPIVFARNKDGWPTVASAARPFGPRPPDEPRICPACGRAIVTGQHTGLVPLGPGVDEGERQRARTGQEYHAIAIECHFACISGSEPDEAQASST